MALIAPRYELGTGVNTVLKKKGGMKKGLYKGRHT